MIADGSQIATCMQLYVRHRLKAYDLICDLEICAVSILPQSKSLSIQRQTLMLLLRAFTTEILHEKVSASDLNLAHNGLQLASKTMLQAK